MYFKITNENEKHNGLQYHDGLVEDILPFNPSGECSEGGIYFCEAKDIFLYLTHGAWVREVTLPDGEEVYRGKNKVKAHRVILGARMRLWDVSTIAYLIEHGADIHAGNDCALRWESENGHIELVKYLKSIKSTR